jgi:hypothetical protein
MASASGRARTGSVVFLVVGTAVEATLVCEEIAPGNRPLAPVLSAYNPGSDPSSTLNADFFNDDGFGLDDDPNGVDCNAFDSSRLRFRAPVNGTYTFRADGFGSSTGPYTLTIVTTPRADLDFDGDNTSDVALYRGASGAFFIGQSLDSSLLPLCCADPSAGDEPTPADYDGDLKADIAVYRGATGAFFIGRSSDDSLLQLCCADPSLGDRRSPATTTATVWPTWPSTGPPPASSSWSGPRTAVSPRRAAATRGRPTRR